jgi:hypothetical protein
LSKNILYLLYSCRMIKGSERGCHPSESILIPHNLL